MPGLFAVAAASVSGCGTSYVPVLLVGGGSDAGADGQASSGPPLLASLGTQQDYCAGSGPPALVDTATDGAVVSTCPDPLAQGPFRYALCTCDSHGYVSDHALVTDAFDGSHGAYDPSTAMAGGSVGVNGDLHPMGLMQVGGSLWASVATDITTSTLEVSGDLHTEGELRPSPTLVVQGDAWMAGGIQSSGDVTVKGTLHIPTGAPVDVAGLFTSGPRDGAAFQVSPPCDCDPSHIVDIVGVVATYEGHNDDASIGLSPTALANVQSDQSMNLPCGRFFLTQIAAGTASILLNVSGRVALFVGGSLSTSDFRVEVPQGSELDLFVAGNVTVRGAFLVGDASNPARARTYVGGGSVNLQSAATLAGNLYAPGANLTIGGTAPTTLYGSIFASELTSTSDLTIHYDEAILTPSSSACAAPTACASCDD